MRAVVLQGLCIEYVRAKTLEMIVFSKINQHGEGCPGQQRAMKEDLAECWCHPLPLTDQPNLETIF